MFNALFEEIEKWMRQLLSGMVTSNLTNMGRPPRAGTAVSFP